MTEKKSSAPGGKAVHGFDGAGHMDAAHAERLHALARQGRSSDDDRAFIDGMASEDELAEELAESAVANMTSGEDALGDDMNAEVEEESGGPFVTTSGRTEFAEGTDESNTADATREPFPIS